MIRNSFMPRMFACIGQPLRRWEFYFSLIPMVIIGFLEFGLKGANLALVSVWMGWIWALPIPLSKDKES